MSSAIPADWVIGATRPRAVSLDARARAPTQARGGCNRTVFVLRDPQIRGKQRSRTGRRRRRSRRLVGWRSGVEPRVVGRRGLAGISRKSPWRTLSVGSRRSGRAVGRLFYLYPEAGCRARRSARSHPVRLGDMRCSTPGRHARRMRRGRFFGGKHQPRRGDAAPAVRHPESHHSHRIHRQTQATGRRVRSSCEFVEWAEFDRVGLPLLGRDHRARLHARGQGGAQGCPRASRNDS